MNIMQIFVLLLSVIVSFGNARYVLLDVKRVEIRLNQSMNHIIQMYNSTNNNSTINISSGENDDVFFRWVDKNQYINQMAMKGIFILEFPNMPRGNLTRSEYYSEKFYVCPYYGSSDPGKMGQNFFDKVYSNYEEKWYYPFSTDRCPMSQNDYFLSPANVQIELKVKDVLPCDRKIKVHIMLYFENTGVSNGYYEGALRCAVESHSTGYWFWRRNSYLTNQFITGSILV